MSSRSQRNSNFRHYVPACIFLFLIAHLYIPLVRAEATVRPAPLPLQDLQRFVEVLNRISVDHVRPVDDSDLIRDAVKGMLDGLNDGSAYLTKEDLTEGPKGGPASVGIEIRRDGGFIRVVAPVAESPAEKAGIKPGQIITKIDSFEITGKSLSEVSSLLRGEDLSPVRLTVIDPLTATTGVVSVQRQILTGIPSAETRILDSSIIYIRLRTFSKSTESLLSRQLADLDSRFGGVSVSGIVLDLRNNTGGLLDSVAKCAGYFLKPGSLLATVYGRRPESSRLLHAEAVSLPDSERFDTRTLPMAVLLNKGTSSGAEMLAAAVRDQKRGALIGGATMGHSSIETIMPLESGDAIKLTTAEWRPANDVSVLGVGIIPQIEASDDQSLHVAIGLLKAGHK